MLANRLRRWPNIKPTLDECFMFSGMILNWKQSFGLHGSYTILWNAVMSLGENKVI